MTTKDNDDLRLAAQEMVKRESWNRYPTDPDRKICGADDGSTVCILPVVP